MNDAIVSLRSEVCEIVSKLALVNGVKVALCNLDDGTHILQVLKKPGKAKEGGIEEFNALCRSLREKWGDSLFRDLKRRYPKEKEQRKLTVGILVKLIQDCQRGSRIGNPQSGGMHTHVRHKPSLI